MDFYLATVDGDVYLFSAEHGKVQIQSSPSPAATPPAAPASPPKQDDRI